LVNSVTDETLLIVSSVSLGAVEILMRTTVHQRDKLGQIAVAKLTGRKFTSFDRSFLMEYKCSLVVLEMIFEMSDIFSMCGFFSFVCQPGGPLRENYTTGSGSKSIREAGFILEDFIIKNGAIQAAIEAAVGMACLTLEIILGFPVLQIVRKGYFLPFFLSSSLFGFFFAWWFFTSLFLYPNVDFFKEFKRNDQTPGPRFNQQYWDYYGTWLYYIPVVVEKAFMIEWTEQQKG